MPFVEPWRRKVISYHGLEGLAEIQPGDRCYFYYQRLVNQWNEAPRWSTVHRLHKGMIEDIGAMDYDLDKDNASAYLLAWQVFFQIKVMPYEIKKREENGDI